ERDPGGDVGQAQMPAEQGDPEDVADDGRDTRAPGDDDGAAEGPQRVAGEAERGDAERDRHDQDAGEQPAQEVVQRQPPAGEEEPEDVADGAHPSTSLPTVTPPVDQRLAPL